MAKVSVKETPNRVHSDETKDSERRSRKHRDIRERNTAPLDEKYPWDLVAFVFAGFCFYHTIESALTFDDEEAIVFNKDLRSEATLSSIFEHDFWGVPMSDWKSHKSYRPITVLTFKLNYWIHGLEPSGYHAVNVILHGIVSAMFYNLSLRICSAFRNPTMADDAAVAATLLFAVHPVHCDAVASVVGRAELLSGLFFLLALLCSDSRLGTFTATLMAVLATLSKETGFSSFPVIVLMELMRLTSTTPPQDRRFVWNRVIWFCVSGVMCGVTRYSLNAGQFPMWAWADNSTMDHPSFLVRLMTYAHLHTYVIRLLVFPTEYAADYSYRSIPEVESLLDLRNLLSLAFYLALATLTALGLKGLWSRPATSEPISKSRPPSAPTTSSSSSTSQPDGSRSDDRKGTGSKAQGTGTSPVVEGVKNLGSASNTLPILTGLVMMVVPFLPSSGVLVPVGFVVAERVMYLPSLGGCLLLGALAAWGVATCKITQNTKLLVAGVIVSLLASRTLARNSDWKSNETLWESNLRVFPDNIKMLGNVAVALNQKGGGENYQRASELLERAISLTPQSRPVEMNLMIALANNRAKQGLYHESKRIFEDVIEEDRVFAPHTKSRLHYNFGVTLMSLEDYTTAETQFRMSVDVDPEYSHAYNNLGASQVRLGKLEDAIVSFSKALELDPDFSDPRINLASVKAHVAMGNNKS